MLKKILLIIAIMTGLSHGQSVHWKDTTASPYVYNQHVPVSQSNPLIVQMALPILKTGYDTVATTWKDTLSFSGTTRWVSILFPGGLSTDTLRVSEDPTFPRTKSIFLTGGGPPFSQAIAFREKIYITSSASTGKQYWILLQ